uniref:Uncharacterized protein n=1 Tax=Trichuris muris TaxID=70415 RepID=A0A5S6Q9L2_TRIMR
MASSAGRIVANGWWWQIATPPLGSRRLLYLIFDNTVAARQHDCVALFCASIGDRQRLLLTWKQRRLSALHPIDQRLVVLPFGQSPKRLHVVIEDLVSSYVCSFIASRLSAPYHRLIVTVALASIVASIKCANKFINGGSGIPLFPKALAVIQFRFCSLRDPHLGVPIASVGQGRGGRRGNGKR